MQLNTQGKFLEEKGRTDEKNEVLKKQVESLEKKIGGSKSDLSFATKMKFSIFGSITLFIAFISGYLWYTTYGVINFTLQNIIFILFLFGVLLYLFIYLLDDILDIIKF